MVNSTFWGLFLYAIIGIIIWVASKIIWKKKEKQLPIKNSSSNTLYRHNMYNDTVEYMDDVSSGLRDQLDLLLQYKGNLEALPYEMLDSTQKDTLKQVDSIIGLIYQSLDPAKWNQIQFDKVFNNFNNIH